MTPPHPIAREGESEQQRSIDTFYWSNGPCCAGCDHWRTISSVAGECTRAAPMSAADRLGLLGITSCTLNIGAGFPITNRHDRCGQFADAFDWTTLPLGYRRNVGCPL